MENEGSGASEAILGQTQIRSQRWAGVAWEEKPQAAIFLVLWS